VQRALVAGALQYKKEGGAPLIRLRSTAGAFPAPFRVLNRKEYNDMSFLLGVLLGGRGKAYNTDLAKQAQAH